MIESADLPPLAEYAIIGDGRTAALCSSSGSIDWLCLPRFDSDPVFGRLIGGEAAGSFAVTVEDRTETSRRYRQGSAVLETTWRTPTARVRLVEGMVLDVRSGLRPLRLLVRRIEALDGEAEAVIRFDPRTGLKGERFHSSHRQGAVVSVNGGLALALRSSPHLPIDVEGETRVRIAPGRPVTLALSVADREPLVLMDPDEAFALLDETDRWWGEWAGRVDYHGPARDAVVRSLITLRLLTYSPSGAPVAAPTTSLPEEIGGGRNWDYRFSWPRDASIGVSAFLAVGLADEAHSFLHWLLVASRLSRPRLHVLYTLDGKPGTSEEEMADAPGYRGSRPVRVGNEASGQHQLDVYGWVVDAAWAMHRSGRPLEGDLWRAAASFADFAASSWRDPDAGIWEVRGRTAHYVHSKLMAWLALDRALRMARSRRVRRRRVLNWETERDALAVELRERGFDPGRSAYVRAYGSDELDAAVLILPTLGFEEEGSPRIEGTIEAIRRELSAGGPLLYRYPPGTDGLPGTEGAFLPCSFWLVQALASTGRVDEARALFDELCSRSNDVGLFGEEMDPRTGEHLGNFPQALTHAALVQAALALQAATEG